MARVFKQLLFLAVHLFYLQVGICQVHAAVADFSAEPTTGTVPLTVDFFTDQSTGTTTFWEWAFGDDNATSTEQNPSHIYNNPGSYTVSLTVDGPEGANTEAKTDYIMANPAVGSLMVTLSPQGAIDGGAQWNVGGGDWQDSGATVSDLNAGEHTINYKDVTGWSPPVSEIVTITVNETKEITRSYVEEPVTIFCVSNATELQTALTTAASNGEDDIIRIVQGTYNGNLVYASTEGNSLTVEGGYTEGCASREVGPANTVLDGGGTDTVLALVSQGSADFSVEGLTLQSGNASTVDDGGGLYAKTQDGNVIITNNTFTGNTADDGGGAWVQGNGTLTNNTFAGNTADHNGGGVYLGGGTLTGNTFTGNTANSGGGVLVGAGFLTGNTFTGNTANSGGGVYLGGGPLTGNTFTENTANYGGGAYIFNAGTLTGNTFTGNTADDGGGVYFSVGDATLINNTFAGNTADTGGGIYISIYNDATLTNNTLTGNVAETEGGGLWLTLTRHGATGSIYNNIIWNNSAPEANDLYIDNTGDDPFFPVPVDLFNNDFDQSTSGTYIKIPFAIDPSNLDNQEPLFVSSDNCHLTPSSPCINIGNNDAVGLPETDKDGNPRIVNDIVDMGAYEYQGTAPPIAIFSGNPTSGPSPLTVNFTDQSTGTITSWEWAFGDGETSTEQNPTHIYNDEGTYTVSLTVTGPVSSDTETKPDYITAISSLYGSLTVTIIPQSAIDAGAEWNVDGGEWQDSGATVSSLSIGTHTVSYKDVIGWDPPSSEFVTINNGQTTQTAGTYTVTVYSPSVATGSASDISFTSARLNGTVNPNGTETTVVFEYGTDTSYGLTTPETSAGSGSDYVAVSNAISWLSSCTAYHFRVKATNSAGTSYGDDKSFTTLSANIVYVEAGGVCGGKSPCFVTIGEGLALAADGATVNIAEGTYNEDIILDEPKELILLCGWDATFTSQISYTIANGLIIRQGKIITYNLILRPLIEASSGGVDR